MKESTSILRRAGLRVATETSLLFRVSERADNAVGDVVEQFQNGRSVLWLWRQIAGIVAHVVVRDVRQGPALAGILIVVGAILTLVSPFVGAAIVTFDEQLFVRGIRWFYLNGPGLPASVSNHPWLITAALYAVTGWIVGRVAGDKKAAALFAFASSVFACGLMSPLMRISIDLTGLRYHFAFHAVSASSIPAILAQHFTVNGHVDFMNVFVFEVVILPLMTVVGGLAAPLRRSSRPGVTA